MSKTFFTADLHLGHANIIKLVHRKDADVESMDARLIDNWNSLVGDNDTVYCLGDFAFGQLIRVREYFKRLKGNIWLLPGNHDKDWWHNVDIGPFILSASQKRICLYPALCAIKISGQTIILCHYPLREWPDYYKGAIHLYGHVHGALEPLPGSLDVGVDAVYSNPVEFDRLKVLIEPQCLT